jgi:hypothetical protein
MYSSQLDRRMTAWLSSNARAWHLLFSWALVSTAWWSFQRPWIMKTCSADDWCEPTDQIVKWFIAWPLTVLITILMIRISMSRWRVAPSQMATHVALSAIALAAFLFTGAFALELLRGRLPQVTGTAEPQLLFGAQAYLACMGLIAIAAIIPVARSLSHTMNSHSGGVRSYTTVSNRILTVTFGLTAIDQETNILVFAIVVGGSALISWRTRRNARHDRIGKRSTVTALLSAFLISGFSLALIAITTDGGFTHILNQSGFFVLFASSILLISSLQIVSLMATIERPVAGN